jgi:hypothetical protein
MIPYQTSIVKGELRRILRDCVLSTRNRQCDIEKLPAQWFLVLEKAAVGAFVG